MAFSQKSHEEKSDETINLETYKKGGRHALISEV
jgi:hypothetical protein